MGNKDILFIMTSHDELGSTGKKTGWYLPEVAHPYNILTKAGFNITVASPKGGKTPLDPGSAEAFKEDPECIAFLADSVATGKVNNSLLLSTIKPSDYAAVVFPGGHGPMYDLATDATSHSVTAAIYEQGGLVAAVCHGPAGIANVKLSSGEYLVKGKKVTGFTNDEEDAVQLTPFMPFMLETRLKENGGYMKRACDRTKPGSSSGLAEAIVEALKK
ncbi:class I glutamine amidotransferase-like protein [Chytridium lagenaria]|nr:class I glutamine amidotransferase-like protein [Chytridium lagenaria]